SHQAYPPPRPTNFYHPYHQHLPLIKHIPLTHYTTSINSSTILIHYQNPILHDPYPPYIHNLINQLIPPGLHPIFSLHHYHLPPLLLHNYGAWSSNH
ncbi:family 1 glycosylhydrolase, partial [Bacillus sp. WP8]|uniref:family 1 glycosylhydrolase n=1 Tax=Bacillus sp. WP8 TaxID=756828 RepID=UPI0011A470DF